jgi:predicted ATPase
MTTFDEIHIQGYRRLADVRLPLRPLNVVVGSGGSGKSSLLEAFHLLVASASGDLQAAFYGINVLQAILTRLPEPAVEPAEELQLSLRQTTTNSGVLSYSLTLRPAGNMFWISRESFTQTKTRPQRSVIRHFTASNDRIRCLRTRTKERVAPDWGHDDRESVLFQIPPEYRLVHGFRKSLSSCVCCRSMDVGPHSPVRRPQYACKARLPGPNGEHLGACLHWMRESSPDRYDVIMDTLKVAFPSFEGLIFNVLPEELLVVLWKEKGISTAFQMDQLSEGSLRFLWLLTLLYSPGLPAVTLLEQPEISLSPRVLPLLVDVLREASRRTQLIVITNSERLVRCLRPDELVVATAEEGLAKFTRADELELENWLAEYTLDQIWSMGRLHS